LTAYCGKQQLSKANDMNGINFGPFTSLTDEKDNEGIANKCP